MHRRMQGNDLDTPTKEVGQKLTQDLLGAGYSVETTATTLFSTAAGGIANLPSTVSGAAIFCYRKGWGG